MRASREVRGPARVQRNKIAEGLEKTGFVSRIGAVPGASAPSSPRGLRRSGPRRPDALWRIVHAAASRNRGGQGQGPARPSTSRGGAGRGGDPEGYRRRRPDARHPDPPDHRHRGPADARPRRAARVRLRLEGKSLVEARLGRGAAARGGRARHQSRWRAARSSCMSTSTAWRSRSRRRSPAIGRARRPMAADDSGARRPELFRPTARFRRSRRCRAAPKLLAEGFDGARAYGRLVARRGRGDLPRSSRASSSSPTASLEGAATPRTSRITIARSPRFALTGRVARLAPDLTLFAQIARADAEDRKPANCATARSAP